MTGRAWASNSRKQEKRGKAIQFPTRRRSAPRVPRSGMEATPPQAVTQEGEPVPLAYAVELRFLVSGLEMGVDSVQICLSHQALRDLIEEYNEMGITFTVLAVIVQGSTSEERDLPPGKLTKKWKRFILEKVQAPGVTIAVAGHAPNPSHDQATEPACLYVRTNYPRP